MNLQAFNPAPFAAARGEFLEGVVADREGPVVEFRVRATARFSEALSSALPIARDWADRVATDAPRLDNRTAPASPLLEQPVVVDPYRRRLWN